MEALILSYKGGKATQKPNQMLLKVEGIDTRAKTAKFIGKKVVWKTPSGKDIFGKIVSPHGNSGAMRARFGKGMPGVSIGTKVSIKE